MMLGWRNDIEPRAELRATACAFAATSFRAPSQVDPRPWLPVENQGQIGSCAGHAITTSLEICNYISTQGRVTALSRMFSYLVGQQAAGLFGRDAGCTISGVVRAAKQVGCCREELFPYPTSYISAIPAAAQEEASQHRLQQHSVLNSYQRVFEFLAAGIGAVVIGVPWRQSLAETEGVIERLQGTVYGGHAVALVGYTTRTANDGRKYILLANSHGKDWGAAGFAEVAPRVIDAWCADVANCELIGVSDLQVFGPRPIPSWVGMTG